ncbi:hypothetical protein I203_107286 [Kwoniella mangroviensis CBS 8507]|uniref:hypothetical protein n=1 Tax=Kwoniella mangroviensis CBS 8507 TaxID=1296122 RepID=UPI003022697F
MRDTEISIDHAYCVELIRLSEIRLCLPTRKLIGIQDDHRLRNGLISSVQPQLTSASRSGLPVFDIEGGLFGPGLTDSHVPVTSGPGVKTMAAMGQTSRSTGHFARHLRAERCPTEDSSLFGTLKAPPSSSPMPSRRGSIRDLVLISVAKHFHESVVMETLCPPVSQEETVPPAVGDTLSLWIGPQMAYRPFLKPSEKSSSKVQTPSRLFREEAGRPS